MTKRPSITRCWARVPPAEVGPQGRRRDDPDTQVPLRFRRVLTKDELRQRLTAELDEMDPEARAANCDGTIDDLITDSVLVGISKRVDQDGDTYAD